MATLRKARLGLEGQHSVLEQSIRDQQRIVENTYGSSFRGSRTGSSSYSYSTSSANDYEYEDDGPLPNRG